MQLKCLHAEYLCIQKLMAMAEKMITEEKARESLIALSYTMPDDHSLENKADVDYNTVTEKKGNSGKFRSELISLSYTLPEEEKLPES